MAETKEAPPSTDMETVVAHAIWHTNTSVADKREIATKLADVMMVANPEDFIRMASDPVYEPTGPWATESDVLVDHREANETPPDPPPEDTASSSSKKSSSKD